MTQKTKNSNGGNFLLKTCQPMETRDIKKMALENKRSVLRIQPWLAFIDQKKGVKSMPDINNNTNAKTKKNIMAVWFAEEYPY
jgi:hypothetical protein